MGKPPSGYSTAVAIPLPTDEQLGADTVAKLKRANDLNFARMLAGTADMLDGATGLVQAVFQAKDIDPKMRELIILRSAYLLDCPYEWQANIVMAKNTGCTQEQIDAMTSQGPPTGMDDKTALVVLATDEITESGTLTATVDVTNAPSTFAPANMPTCWLPQTDVAARSSSTYAPRTVRSTPKKVTTCLKLLTSERLADIRNSLSTG